MNFGHVISPAPIPVRDIQTNKTW